jgi:hypothetical protein
VKGGAANRAAAKRKNAMNNGLILTIMNRF